MRVIAIWFLGLFFGIGSIHAQENTMSISFSTLSWRGKIDGIYYYDQGKRINVEANPYSSSSGYSYTGPSVLVFYKQGTNALGESIDVPVASVKGLKIMKSPLLVIIPDDDKMEIIAFPDDVEDFKAGEYRFINLTSDPIAAKIGNTSLFLEPYKHETVLPDIPNEQSSLPLQVAVEEEDKGEWKLAYSVGWGHEPDNRIRVFVYRNPTGKIRVRRIEEHRSKFE
ncbi:hypothetical protein [Rubellicoccus peritrichatus]|uniref:Uncharacterized protein n=1 Tax=Rubellicoccus peritrichatus TaxID=3080537 RepID=A0AAQ3L657_9BACT|nr:hypothetical protein [Puniceicoccus sp. CR14]WOO39776.1 hypothetical protein RZN69_14220 [Puniceicoccus sp. CR14]